MKRGWNKQQGISVWGVLAIIFGVLIVFWIAIKVVPEYMEAATVQKCLEDSKTGGGADFVKVQQRFGTCLDFNSIRGGVQPKDLALKGSVVSVKWEKQLPIAANISLLLEFDAQAPK
ncbi:MAG: DUF4845 domain-containing protein [Burkholderiales bacterium]|nr:DUF4845 domain-containing protein [Burkholderiales bacterium]